MVLSVGLVVGLVWGLVGGLFLGLVGGLGLGLVFGLVFGLIFGLVFGLIFGLGLGLVFALPAGWPFKRSTVSSRLTLTWPSTRRQRLDFLRRTGRGLFEGLVFGLNFGLIFGLAGVLAEVLFFGLIYWSLVVDVLAFGLIFVLGGGLIFALAFGLLETRSELIISRTPKEAHSRSMIAAWTWLFVGLVGGLGLGLVFGLVQVLFFGLAGMLVQVLVFGLIFVLFGLFLGLVGGLRNGGGFVLLQKVAHRRLARAGNLPPHPYVFLEWGIERHIFRRVGGGVRFRHNLIQQHLASTPEGTAQG